MLFTAPFQVGSSYTIQELAIIVTVQESDLMPFVVSSAVTLIIAVPGFLAETMPSVTIAASELLLHITFLLVALDGVITAVRVSVPPTIRLIFGLFKVTPVTGTDLTSTGQVAFKLPSTVVAVIVVVPCFLAETMPFADTSAASGLVLLHVTFLLVALEGVMVGVRVAVSPTKRLMDVLSNDMPFGGTELTVTVQESDLTPFVVSDEVTVIVVVPTPTPVTTPPVDTVAAAVLLLFHVTFWFVALEGSILTKRISMPSTIRLVDFLFRETRITGTALSPTLIIQAA